jgi:hypothetical protein
VALGKCGTSHALFSLGSNREHYLNPIGFLAEQVLPRTCLVFVNGIAMMGSLIPEQTISSYGQNGCDTPRRQYEVVTPIRPSIYSRELLLWVI